MFPYKEVFDLVEQSRLERRRSILTGIRSLGHEVEGASRT